MEIAGQRPEATRLRGRESKRKEKEKREKEKRKREWKSQQSTGRVLKSSNSKFEVRQTRKPLPSIRNI